LLRQEIVKKKPGEVWISGVCDPYQSLEAKYLLTRKCLEILSQYDWPVIIQTRSPLVLRDIDILQEAHNFQVGFSITTADDSIRKLFELHAPPIQDRVTALDTLHQAGIKTYAMIAPILPGAEGLVGLLKGKVDYILIDRMNYNYADGIYRKYGLQDKLTNDYFSKTAGQLTDVCRKCNIECEVLF
jgi:DNA repair photolyase